MKTNIVVLWVLTAYFAVLTAVYTVWAIIDTGELEWIGTIAIGLSGGLSALIAFYLQSSAEKPRWGAPRRPSGR
jgi:hypothetical protein